MQLVNERIITHFGSGFTPRNDPMFKKSEKIGFLLGKSAFTVCSGGYSGIMEAVSKGAKKANGKTMGVTVETWDRIPNRYIDEEIKMPNLMERITELIALGDAYVIYPGGTGTLVEIATTLEFMNKKAMKEKKMIFFTSFWKRVINTLKLDSKSLSKLIDRNSIFANSPESVVSIITSLDL